MINKIHTIIGRRVLVQAEDKQKVWGEIVDKAFEDHGAYLVHLDSGDVGIYYAAKILKMEFRERDVRTPTDKKYDAAAAQYPNNAGLQGAFMDGAEWQERITRKIIKGE